MPPHLQKLKDEDGPGPIGPSMPPSGPTGPDDSIGPALPTPGPIGPGLPPSLKSSDSSIGPALPPHLRGDDSPEPGPALPPHLQKPDDFGPALPNEESDDDDYGPSLPPGFGPPVKGPTMPPTRHQMTHEDSSSDEEIVGPLPPSMMSQAQSEEHILAEFNRREERMKLKLSGVDVDGEHKLEREEWMTELPSLRQGNQIIGATTFRKNGVIAAESGRSEWTKTPNAASGAHLTSKERKVEDQKRIDYLADQVKNRKQEEILAKQKRQSESLMQSHAKKMRKKEKEERNKPGYKKERMAFDREKDMQGSIIDDAKRKQLLKKQTGLGNRFGSGNSKFL